MNVVHLRMPMWPVKVGSSFTVKWLVLYHVQSCTYLCQDITTTTPDLECVDGDVRLVDGPNVREGRVEVCINRAWGTVCDELFNDADAKVICLQMEFSAIGKFKYMDTVSCMYVVQVYLILYSCMVGKVTFMITECLLSLHSFTFCGMRKTFLYVCLG